MDFIAGAIKKYDDYKGMHKMLRELKLNNQPLPETVQEMQQLYMMSS